MTAQARHRAMPDIAVSILELVREELSALRGRDRLQAVRDLAPYAWLPAVEARLRELATGDRDPRVQIVANEVLRSRGAAEFADATTDIATDTFEPETGPELAARLEGGTAVARLELLWRLASGPGGHAGLARALAGQATRATVALEAAAAVAALARLGGKDALPELAALSTDSRPRVAAAALEARARLEGPEAWEVVAAALGVDSGLVRCRAARALASIDAGRALELLGQMLASSPEAQSREKAQDCVFALGTAEARALLAASLATEKELALVDRAAELLGRSGSRDVIPLLVAARDLPPDRARPALAALEELRKSLGIARGNFAGMVQRFLRPEEPAEGSERPAGSAGRIALGLLALVRRPEYRVALVTGSFAAIFLIIGLVGDTPATPEEPAAAVVEPVKTVAASVAGTVARTDAAHRLTNVCMDGTNELVTVSVRLGLPAGLAPGRRVRVEGRPGGTDRYGARVIEADVLELEGQAPVWRRPGIGSALPATTAIHDR
ncbi:MAG: hypothetical protein HY303_15330 [Candidatus Wallbacteria bacterium]|nr:hypothetical protein [Candidatus Wallbacteria bacterium]